MPSIPTSTATPFTRVLKSWQAWDDSRDSFSAEHWLVLAVGLAVLLAASRSASPVKRTVASVLGAALLYRAASGRDGVARLLRHP